MTRETAARLRGRIEDGLRACEELRRLVEEEKRPTRPQLRVIQGGRS
ncbi:MULTISPECIES: hypothetical protein [unclassified Kribbella]